MSLTDATTRSRSTSARREAAALKAADSVAHNVMVDRQDTRSVTRYASPAKGKGYEVSRFNAVKHGALTSSILPWEDAAEYADLLNDLIAEHAPSGPTELHLTMELGNCIWRKRRVYMGEADVLRRRGVVALADGFVLDNLERLGRYATHLDRKFERTLAMLVRLKELRRVPEPG